MAWKVMFVVEVEKKLKSKQLRIPFDYARGTFQWGHAPRLRVRETSATIYATTPMNLNSSTLPTS